MKYFFLAVADTRYVDVAFEVASEYTERLVKQGGPRLGVMVRFTAWRRRACIPCRLAEDYGVPLFVDNGAFDLLKAVDLDRPLALGTQLDLWVSLYASWLADNYVYLTAAAMPDIPVHGRRFVDAVERLRRIELTRRLHLRLARTLRRLEPAALERMVLVLQGYEVHEYQLSASMLLTPELADTLTMQRGGKPYAGVAGVGSVCVRKPSARGKTGVLASGLAAGSLIDFLRAFLGSRWPREVLGFHFFGLHTDAVKRFHWHTMYYGSDTGSHGLYFRYKWRTMLGCKTPDSRDCYRRALERQIKVTLSPYLALGGQPLTRWVGGGGST